MKKKFFSILLSLAMVITMMPMMAMTAFATGHEHNGVTFTTEWSTDNAMPATSGSYYLTTDVTIATAWDVPAGTTDLCLNGHSITYTGSTAHTSTIMISAGETLNLYECQTTVHKFYYDYWGDDNRCWHPKTNELQSGQVESEVYGGYITSTHNSTTTEDTVGGVINKGTFNMYGGNIVGNYKNAPAGSSTEDYGAAILNLGGTFTMHGGSIVGNSNGGYCQASVLYNSSNGTFIINDGDISRNSDMDNLITNELGEVKINGGEIHDNRAGLSDESWASTINNFDKLEITGVKIYNNAVKNYGFGGALQNNSVCDLSAAAGKSIEITNNSAQFCGGVCNWGEMNISGAIIIKNNRSTNETNDFAPDVDPADEFELNVVGPLTGSQIDFTTVGPDANWNAMLPIKGVLTNGYSTYNSPSDFDKIFHFTGQGEWAAKLNEDGEIEVVNIMDVIDEKLKELEDKIGNGGSSSTVQTSDVATITALLNSVTLSPKATLADNGKADLYWNKIDTEVGYEVYGDGKLLATVKTNSFEAPVYAKYTVKPFVSISGTKIYGRESDPAKLGLAKNSITSLKSKAKKKFTVKFSKVPGAQTYEIMYKQAGKKWKTATTKSLTKTIKKLSSKKKYSVKVRGVYAAGNVSAASPWSATKTVKVK